ncbi:MAG: site-specific integrase [Bacilli bacterium]|nr:site-specific integrase [Bacilli bacterium]
MNFNEVYTQFKIYAKKRHKKQSFCSLMSDFELKVLPYFKDYDIFKLNEKDILKWKDDILSYDYSNSYNDRIYYVFSMFLDYCCIYYDLPQNVLRNVGPFKPKIEISKRDFYTLKEFKKYIKNIDNIIYKSYFIIMFYTGCRPSECMALKFSDFDGKYIHITKSIQRRGKRELDTPKNKYSIRDIILNRKSKKCIKKLKKYYISKYGYDYDYFILGGLRPLAPTTIDRYKSIACKKANLKVITQHQFRHSYATYLISHNIPLNVVSKMLGHSNVETTARIYVHQDLSQEKRVLKTLNSHFFRFNL